MTFVWLIERGQPERQVPTVWWSGERRDGGDDWTTDPWQALRFETKADAEAQIDREYFGAGGGKKASARAVEHGFGGDRG